MTWSSFGNQSTVVREFLHERGRESASANVEFQSLGKSKDFISYRTGGALAKSGNANQFNELASRLKKIRFCRRRCRFWVRSTDIYM